MEGVLHKRGRGRTNINLNGSWTERIVQVTYEERELKYYDTSLVLKGKMALGKDLKVRLVDAKEVEGRPNAFEVSSGEEKIVFSSIMPSGAEKWFNFLKNFNKLIDQKVIKDEKQKQLEWVDGVIKSVQSNFQGNPIALRINLQDLLKTNVALTKSIDESTLICPEDVSAELLDLSKTVRTHYLTSVNAAIAALRDEAMAIVRKVTAALYQLSEVALYQVTTQGFAFKLVGNEKGSSEVILGLSVAGPIVTGNATALDLWVQRVYQALRSVLSHFLTGKSYNDKLFMEYGTCVAMAGLVPSDPSVTSLLAEIKAATAPSPVSLDERDVTAELAAFDDKFMKQYCVRAAQELCRKFDPAKVLDSALLCELSFSAAGLWEAKVESTTEWTPLPGELAEAGMPMERIAVTQVYPPPPPRPAEEGEPLTAEQQEAEWDADQAGGADPERRASAVAAASQRSSRRASWFSSGGV